jgi:hypothetical protein
MATGSALGQTGVVQGNRKGYPYNPREYVMVLQIVYSR